MRFRGAFSSDFSPSRWHATLEKPGSSSSDAATTLPSQEQRLPGTAQLDTPWEELGFEFRPTRSHLKMLWSDGSWQEPTLVEGEPYLQIHIGATALHYGQSCFEGLKAFCHADGTVHLFCPEENARRMQSSCRRTLMAELPTDRFVEACRLAVRDNIEYVPPYGSNGALYIRPLLFGSGPRIGLQPADEYTFLCMVIPVGDYYKGGLSSPVRGRLITDYDRAAPRGVVRSPCPGSLLFALPCVCLRPAANATCWACLRLRERVAP
jgi:branched-chain amino acid aminotransferase